MAIDYVAFQDLAKTLIDDNGREILLIQSATSPADGAKPWRGSSAPHTGASAVEVAATGIFLDYTEKDTDLTLIKRGEKRCLVAVTDLAPPTDVAQFDAIKDVASDEVWRIIEATILQPGSVRILYDFKISQ